MSKKVFAIVMAAVLLCGTACAETVTGTAFGMKSDITVEVELNEGVIEDVRVAQHDDTPVVADAAIASVPARIVEQQNIEVDVATGATLTSIGIRNAVRNALETAGLDPAAYKKGSDRVEAKAEGEEETVDLVIVGGGIAGMSAAIQAKRDGVERVVVLERNAYAGGSSLLCGGGIWVVNTDFNREIGVDPTVEEFIAFFEESAGGITLNEGLLTHIYDNAAQVFEYLADNGLPYATDTWSLGHPDSQLAVLWSEKNKETPWATGHSGYFDAVCDAAIALGAELRLNSRVTGLVSEGNTVTGVTVEDQSSVYTVHAQKVILATGGFTRNSELVARYAPEYTKAFAFTGAGSNGDGILMTETLGAQVIGQGMMGLRGTTMNYGYYNRVGNLAWSPKALVNKEGEDFGMGTAFYGETLKLLLEQTDACGIGIFDSTMGMNEDLDAAVDAGIAQKFDSLEALAAAYGIEAGAMAVTCEAVGVADGPYYGMTIRPLFIGSIPGLLVDEDCRVLNAQGEPIENLMAAGELIFANLFQSYYPSSGTGIGMSTYSGSLAAKTAATEMAQ